jgi:alpha-tubulin suppressor-like RCC1 family protein
VSWGRGEDGQLGHGHAESSTSPQAVLKLKEAGITRVYCGAEYSVGVATEGREIYSWGW